MSETESTERMPSRFEQRPILVFWETTKSCLLACQHCRAQAQREPLPGELTTTEAEQLLADIADFGHPASVVVFTGGDLLMRRDIFHLLAVARSLGLHTAVAPSATPLLDSGALAQFAECGVHSLSLSLDAPQAVHDRIRGVPGTFTRTLAALRDTQAVGLTVQINTVVMRRTVESLPEVVSLLRRERVRIWEVFFLIATGRALSNEDLSPAEWTDVCSFLLDVTGYGILVRTIEGPFIRQVLQARQDGTARAGPLYRRLHDRLIQLEGPPSRPTTMPRIGTLDGDGILFVSSDGWIMPGGFLPLRIGHVRRDRIAAVYRDHPLLMDIRQRRLHGPCGRCPLSRACGGSRARSYAQDGDALGSDPACAFATLVP